MSHRNGNGAHADPIIFADPVSKRLDAVEKLLRQLIARTPTQAQLQEIVRQQWEQAYQAKFRELNDLRDDAVKRLRAASPCRNAGLLIAGLTRDYAGRPVPMGSAPDIGANECVAGGVQIRRRRRR